MTREGKRIDREKKFDRWGGVKCVWKLKFIENSVFEWDKLFLQEGWLIQYCDTLL